MTALNIRLPSNVGDPNHKKREAIMNKTVLPYAAFLVMLSCNSTETPPETKQGALVATVESDAPGYQHALSRSKFAIGDGLNSRSEFGMSKVVGAWGVFATVASTGWAMGLPNATSPERSVPPLTTSADAHNRAVLDYFVNAGLPADQVDRVAIGTTVGGYAMAMDNFVPSPPELQFYTSSIFRKVSGIKVVESFAVASMNVKMEPAIESIYWPPVPAAVIASAKSLSALVSDGARGPTFLAKLPAGASHGEVVIHLTPPGGGDAEGIATFDFIDRGSGGGVVRHFLPDGSETLLAAERGKGTVGTPKVAPSQVSGVN
jgi:hypothetical protein